MDRDIALTLNGKLSAINTSLQNIVNGIQNSAESNRSIPDRDQRLSPSDEIETPEPTEKK